MSRSSAPTRRASARRSCVAKDATLSGGTAACVPAPENCLYITLEKGETATLDFGPDGQTYELRLLEIRDVELKTE